MPAKHDQNKTRHQASSVRNDVQERKRRWRDYFKKLVRDWQYADETGDRSIISPKDIAAEIGVSEVTIRNWLRSAAYPNMDNVVRVAQWARRPTYEVMQAAGHQNAQHDSGYARILELLEAVAQTAWQMEYKALIQRSLERAMDPNWLNDANNHEWAELIDHALSQRVRPLIKAERVHSLFAAYDDERERIQRQQESGPSALANP